MYKMLIVDDEYVIREGLSKIDWNSIGIEIAAVCDHGLSAYQWVTENTVDIILTDIHMPIMGGLELAKLIKQNYPYISIVILTGYADFEYARTSLKYGVADYLMKPIELEELQKTFTAIVDKLKEKQQQKLKYSIMERKNRIFSSLLKINFLKELFNTPLSAEEIEEGLNYSEIYLESNNYTVLLFRLDGLKDNQISYDNDEFKLITFAINNIIAEFCTAKELGYSWVDTNTADCYLLINNNREENKGSLTSIAEEVIEALYSILGLIKTTISCGIGSTEHELTKIILSSENARRALLHRKTEGEIITYNSSIQANEECRVDIKNREKDSNSLIENAISIDEGKHRMEAAIKYINENFTKSITLEEVAGKVYLAPAYFSSLFKHVSGMNFINYLTSCRIRKAKDLLRDPKLKIQDVSEAVGYENSRYFSQVFKKYTGSTPFEFRSCQ